MPNHVKVRYEQIVLATKKAVKFRIGHKEAWLPRSQFEWSGVIDRPLGGIVFLAQWLADEKEIPYQYITHDRRRVDELRILLGRIYCRA